jgi:hypothetical protein
VWTLALAEKTKTVFAIPVRARLLLWADFVAEVG